MAKKVVKAELTSPIQDADGTVVHQPGDLFEQDDPFLQGLPPGHFRYVIVEEPDKPAKAVGKASVSKTESGG